MDEFTNRLIKGLLLLEPYIERTTLEYVPACFEMSGTPKNPSILFVAVEPNVMEVPEDVAAKLKELGWYCEDDFHWTCYEA